MSFDSRPSRGYFAGGYLDGSTRSVPAVQRYEHVVKVHQDGKVLDNVYHCLFLKELPNKELIGFYVYEGILTPDARSQGEHGVG